MTRIGILGFQGAYVEHKQRIESLGQMAVDVRYPAQLSEIDGIILPGGESTTIGKLLVETGMKQPLQDHILSGLPVWGTCAGMILLAKKIANDNVTHLGVMDIMVKRNAYGTQINSFETVVSIPLISDRPVPLIFIRAPYIMQTGKEVKVICKVDGYIVAAQQGKMLVTSFHPELTDDLSFHSYFISLCK